MNRKTHVAFAEIGFLIAAILTGDHITFMEMSISPGIGAIPAMIAAVLPDVDMKNSTLGKKFPLISKFCTHRGFTHTAVVNCGLLFLLLATRGQGESILIRGAQSLMFGVVFAYASHLLSDLHNYKGIPLFWPLSKVHVYIMRVTTGKIDEQIFLVATILLAILHLITLGM